MKQPTLTRGHAAASTMSSMLGVYVWPTPHVERRRRSPQSLAARLWRGLRALWRASAARARERKLARETYDTLHSLDAHTLHDLGLDRSEIESVAAEMAGFARPTRVRTPQRPAGRP